jgi:magnesium-transporting ATPase (P-type)
MKWMFVVCLLLVLVVFLLPFFGVESIQAYRGWLFFGIILLMCLVPMLFMNRRKKNK